MELGVVSKILRALRGAIERHAKQNTSGNRRSGWPRRIPGPGWHQLLAARSSAASIGHAAVVDHVTDTSDASSDWIHAARLRNAADSRDARVFSFAICDRFGAVVLQTSVTLAAQFQLGVTSLGAAFIDLAVAIIVFSVVADLGDKRCEYVSVDGRQNVRDARKDLKGHESLLGFRVQETPLLLLRSLVVRGYNWTFLGKSIASWRDGRCERGEPDDCFDW